MDHLSGKILVPKNVSCCLKKWTNAGANLAFTMCRFFFMVFAGLAVLGFGAFFFSVSLGHGGLRCCTTPVVGEWMRRGEKGHPKSRKTRNKHAGNMKLRKTSRLFEAHLGIFSGLVDQGLVARCVRVLQYQLSSTITCLETKGTTKSKPWKICHFLSRDNKFKLPYLIGWLHARSARRNLCLAMSSKSWTLKVSVRHKCLGLPCVCGFLRVRVVLERCDVVAFFASFFFFFFVLFFLLFSFFFHFHFFQFVHFFLFSFLFFLISSFFSCFFPFSVFFSLFLSFSLYFSFIYLFIFFFLIFFPFSLFLLEIACRGAIFSQAVNENLR